MTSLLPIPSAAAAHRCGIPPPPRRRLLGAESPDRAVQREEVEQPHQPLGPLHEVSDGVRLERMQHPDRSHNQCQPARDAWGDRRERGPAGPGQRPPQYAEQDETRGDVDEQVKRVVAADVLPGDGVVDREGERGDGPAGERRILRRPGRLPHRPEPADVRVRLNGLDVVKDERPAEAVVVGGRRHDRQNGGNRPVLPFLPLHKMKPHPARAGCGFERIRRNGYGDLRLTSPLKGATETVMS